MIIVQLILYCLFFTAMVRFAVRGGAVDGLYFYPKPVQERTNGFIVTVGKVYGGGLALTYAEAKVKGERI